MNNNCSMAWYVIPLALVLALVAPLTLGQGASASATLERVPGGDLSEVTEEPSYEKDTVGWSGTSLEQIQQYRLDGALRGGALERASLDLPSDMKWLHGSPVVLSPDAKLMLVVRPPKDGNKKPKLILDVWNLETRQRLQTLKSTDQFKGRVEALAFSQDSRHVIAATKEKSVHLWHWERDRDDFQKNKVVLKNVMAIHSLAVSPNGARVLAAGSSRNPNNVLWFWSTNRTEAEVLQGHKPSNLSLLTTAVQVVLAPLGVLWYLVSKPVSEVTAVAFAPDGVHALSGGKDRTVRLWDLNRKQPLLHTFQEVHKKEVTALAFSPSCSEITRCNIASGDASGFLRVWKWKVADWKNLQQWDGKSSSGRQPTDLSFGGYKSAIDSLVFAPVRQGQRLFSGSQDGQVRLWELDSEAAKTGSARAMVTLTPPGARENSASLVEALAPSGGDVRVVSLLDSTGKTPKLKVWRAEPRVAFRKYADREKAINVLRKAGAFLVGGAEPGAGTSHTAPPVRNRLRLGRPLYGLGCAEA